MHAAKKLLFRTNLIREKLSQNNTLYTDDIIDICIHIQKAVAMILLCLCVPPWCISLIKCRLRIN